MGRLSYRADAQTKEEVDVSSIAGQMTEDEKNKLRSGDGFVRVPHEELCRQRVSVYSYLM